MIREERNPAFWVEVMSHPAVFGAVGQPSPQAIAEIVTRPGVLPLAAEHGGFIFSPLDALGRVAELHTAFTPKGWGREANAAGKEALNRVFRDTFQVLVTYELADNPRSQPPRSFGFVAAGDMAPSPMGLARTWMLTAAGWRGSPVYLRSCH